VSTQAPPVAATDVRRLAAAIRSRDEAAVRKFLEGDARLARHPRVVNAAAGAANLKVLRRLLRLGADPDARHRGYRPLHALIQERLHGEVGDPAPHRLACAKLLLEAGAHPELPGAYPPTGALLIAAFTGSRPFVDLLREAGARVDGFVHAALGQAPAVRRLLDRDPAFATARADGGLTALQCAAASRLGRHDARTARGLAATARALLDAGADANARTKAWSEEVDTAYFAASSRNLEIFRLLLERGADATAALPSAVWNALEEFSQLALTHGADPDRATSNGKPLLNDLIRWGQVKPALWLMERGASPNVTDDAGWTAVHQAASRGNARVLAAVLDAGGDRRRKDKKGCTPLVIATRAGRKKVVELLTGTRSCA
jgi:ankyrin repeat protein